MYCTYCLLRVSVLLSRTCQGHIGLPGHPVPMNAGLNLCNRTLFTQVETCILADFHSVTHHQHIDIKISMNLLFNHCLIILIMIIFYPLYNAHNSLNVSPFISNNQKHSFTILGIVIHYEQAVYSWYNFMFTHFSTNVSHTHHSINYEDIAIKSFIHQSLAFIQNFDALRN